MEKESKYKLVLGLEIHMHVNTEKKMFCGCSAKVFGEEPNTHTCPTCLGLPGALPVPNFEAVKKTQMLGIALNSKLNEDSRFDRKHYFYPDLPKGYQISQYEQPLCLGGYLELGDSTKIQLERIHIEEDTAKSFHERDKTLVDFNVSGIPLMEIVTKPTIQTVEDATEFSKSLQDLVRFLDISDADMEKGQMRIEPNISLQTPEQQNQEKLPSYKVEIKNINSFRFMEKAVNYEVERQSKLLENGDFPIRENRGWNEKKGVTVEQRFKEEAHDYRYFPEPDIPPMQFDYDHFGKLKKDISELPSEARKRLISKYKVTKNNAEMLTVYPGIELLENFEELVKKLDIEANKIANLLINKQEFRSIAPDEFKKKVEETEDTVKDEEKLTKIILEVLSKNKMQVKEYKSGKEAVLQYLLGQVMRKSKGKADPKLTLELLKSKIKK